MAYQKFTAVMASGVSLTGAIDLGNQPAFRRLYIDPTGAAAEVRVYTAAASTDTYRYLAFQNVASGSAGIMKIGSALSGTIVEIPGGIRFLKVETTAAVANGMTFNLFGSD